VAPEGRWSASEIFLGRFRGPREEREVRKYRKRGTIEGDVRRHAIGNVIHLSEALEEKKLIRSGEDNTSAEKESYL